MYYINIISTIDNDMINNNLIFILITNTQLKEKMEIPTADIAKLRKI